MATILPMSQESLDNRIQPPGYANHGSVATSASASRGAAAAYPTAAATAATTTTTTASLSEVASAALADVGPSSAESDSSQNSRSRGGGGMQFVAGSSNGSLGGSQTDDTSPKSAQSVRKQREDAAGRLQRPYTPDRPVGGVQNAERSPQESESSRVKQGAKRTASGAVKGIGNGYSTADLGQNYVPRGHARTKSSTRAVEISNALKARLAYAMVKVNNGWENQSLDQLEHISRMSSPSITGPSTTSPQRRRFSLNSEYNDRYITSPDMQHSPQQYSSRSAYQATYATYSTPVVDTAGPTFASANGIPTLAPAAPIAAGRSHRRSSSTKAPPMLTTAHGYNGPAEHVVYSSQPTTPRRQGILRMPSQQAEKDALDSLLFMASPNNSSNLKYTDSPVGPSPLRTEFPAAVKRVVFES